MSIPTSPSNTASHRLNGIRSRSMIASRTINIRGTDEATAAASASGTNFMAVTKQKLEPSKNKARQSSSIVLSVTNALGPCRRKVINTIIQKGKKNLIHNSCANG